MDQVKCFFDDKVINFQDLKLWPFQRALFYGESIFTSSRTICGKFLSLESHFERLERSIQYLFPDLKFLDKGQILRGIKQIQENWGKRDFYFKIFVFRSPILERRNCGENLKSQCSQLQFLIISKALDNSSFYDLSTDPIDLFSVKEEPANLVWPSFIKTSQYMRTIWHLEQTAVNSSHNEIIYFDNELNILDGGVSSIVLFKNNKYYLPQYTRGILESILREEFKKFLKNNNLLFEVAPISYTQVKDSDEIYLLNCVKGPKQVHCYFDFDKIKYYKSASNFTQLMIYWKIYVDRHLTTLEILDFVDKN